MHCSLRHSARTRSPPACAEWLPTVRRVRRCARARRRTRARGTLRRRSVQASSSSPPPPSPTTPTPCRGQLGCERSRWIEEPKPRRNFRIGAPARRRIRGRVRLWRRLVAPRTPQARRSRVASRLSPADRCLAKWLPGCLAASLLGGPAARVPLPACSYRDPQARQAQQRLSVSGGVARVRALLRRPQH